MDKIEKKLIKLQVKAQECASRKKAQKILKKVKKVSKNNKNVSGHSANENHLQ